jgi:hypothetical protein
VKAGGLIAVALVATLGTAIAGASRRPPIVRVAALQPLVVQGARFHARERVTVTYVGAVRRQRRIVTSRAGAFTTSFANLPVDRCSGFSLSAVGAAGDRAEAKHKPLPACAPA